jgi:hypothetical protein
VRKIFDAVCVKSNAKDVIEVKKEWDKLKLDIENINKIAAQEALIAQRQRERERKLYDMLDLNCKTAINNRFNTFGINRYGVISGAKITQVIKNVTYEPDFTRTMGRGNNFLSIYTVLSIIYRNGNPSDSLSPQVYCISNTSSQVLGLEVNYR